MKIWQTIGVSKIGLSFQLILSKGTSQQVGLQLTRGLLNCWIKEDVIKCLEKMVVALEVGFDANDEKQMEDLQKIGNRLFQMASQSGKQ